MSFTKAALYQYWFIYLILLITSPSAMAQQAEVSLTEDERKPTDAAQSDLNPPSIQTGKVPTVADVDAKLAEVKAVAGLEEEEASSSKELLQDAKLNLQAAAKLKSQAAS